LLTATEETALIAEASDGDVAAFEQLYRMHSGRVYGLCIRLAGNHADAQDATQQTFIKAWAALDNFRGGSAFSTWLHRIAFNEVMGTKRKRATEHRHLQLVDRDDSVDEAPLTEIGQLERAIAELPDRAREALVLHKIYGYTHQEAAEIMSVAVGTCKAQVHRALTLLRDIMTTGEPAAADRDHRKGTNR
jgi:RNA polymerase sigma-70 factor (ECF subfamily)